VSLSIGISTLMFFRLCSRAPRMVMYFSDIILNFPSLCLSPRLPASTSEARRWGERTIFIRVFKKYSFPLFIIFCLYFSFPCFSFLFSKLYRLLFNYLNYFSSDRSRPVATKTRLLFPPPDWGAIFIRFLKSSIKLVWRRGNASSLPGQIIV